MTRLLILCDRFFSLPAYVFFALAALLFVAVLAVVRVRRSALDRRVLRVSLLAVVVTVVSVYGAYRVFRVYTGVLGERHLPKVTLLAPKVGGTTVELRAHATDLPGALGPIAAVRAVEFWLYHPSFVEQHAGNRESKVFFGSVSGPTPDDLYATSWTCSDSYTPA